MEVFTDGDDLRRILPAEFLDRYELCHVLGRGGHGLAVKAIQRALHREVVIKFLLLSEALPRKRFAREGDLLSRIRHPGVVRLFDTGSSGDLHYLVLEYLRGETLFSRLRRGPIVLEDVIRITVDVLAGLEAIHSVGVVHRDLKPANIMVLPDGHAIIIDFGVARATGAEGLTAAGSFLGTPCYASPEQLCGETASARSDLYSLGVILYEELAGENPFLAPDMASLVHNHLALPIHQVPSRIGDHPALQSLVVDLLKKQPDLRPSSADEAGRRLLGPGTVPGWTGAVSAFDPPPQAPAVRKARRTAPSPPVPPGSWRLASSGPPAAEIPRVEDTLEPVRSRIAPLLICIFVTSITAGIIWTLRSTPAPPISPAVTAASSRPTPEIERRVEAVRSLLMQGIQRVLQRRRYRLEHLTALNRWEFNENRVQREDFNRVSLLITDFQEVDRVLTELERGGLPEELPARPSCVIAALTGLRYMLRAELSGEHQLSRRVSLPEFPRVDLAAFFQSIPKEQDVTSLFYLRKASVAIIRALTDCSRDPTYPHEFGDLLRMSFEIFWFADAFTWKEPVRKQRDAEYARFTKALDDAASRNPGCSRTADLLRTSSLAAREPGPRSGSGPAHETYARELRELIESGILPRSLSGQTLGGYASGGS